MKIDRKAIGLHMALMRSVFATPIMRGTVFYKRQPPRPSKTKNKELNAKAEEKRLRKLARNKAAI